MEWTEETQMQFPMFTLKDERGEVLGRVLPNNSSFRGVLYVRRQGAASNNKPLFLPNRTKSLAIMKRFVEKAAELYHEFSTH